MYYGFVCPLDGMSSVLTVDAKDDSEAVIRLTEKAKEHFVLSHPLVKKTDEEVRANVQFYMLPIKASVIN